MTVAEQVAALERENAELKAKVAALESRLAGTPVYVPYPVYPPVPAQPLYPWPWDPTPITPWITWTTVGTTDMTEVRP